MRPLGELTKRGQVARLRVLGHAALRSWGMEGAELRPLSHSENTTFDVRSPRGRFMLRVARPGYRTDAELESEVDFLEHLDVAWSGGAAPRPVRAADGAAVVLAGARGVPEERRCVLFEWLDGRMCWSSLSPARLRALGRAQASLHDIQAEFEAPAGFSRPRGTLSNGYPARWWREADDLPPELVEAFEAAHDVGAPVYEALMEEDGAHGLIHMDMHPWNVLFRPGGEVGVIDFDDMTWAPLIMDVVVVVDSLSSHEDAGALVGAFIAGYREVRELPREWLDMLPVLRPHFYVNGVAWLRARSEIPALRARYARYIVEVRADIERELARAGRALG